MSFYFVAFPLYVSIINLSVNQQKTRNFDTVQVVNFPNNASWDDLRNHYLIVHPKESKEIATLTTPQVIELRERLRIY